MTFLRMSALTCFILLTVFLPVMSQTTLAGWDFEDQNAVADYGTVNPVTYNLNQQILENEGGTVTYPSGNAPSAGESFSTNNWALDEGIIIPVNTTNYTNLTIEFDARSSSTGPRDFHWFYSVSGPDGPYTAIPETKFKSPLSFAANPMFCFLLPSECSDSENLILRMQCVSDTNAAGEAGIGSTGTVRLDNVRIVSSLDQPLPVSLLNFQAISGDEQITLRWQTASEINNLGFIIYRAQEKYGNYAILDSYIMNSRLKGAGNSTQTVTYQYLDRMLINGEPYWYKIADVDVKGTETLHGPVSTVPDKGRQEVHEEVPGAFKLWNNFPDPFNPATMFRVDIPVTKQRIMKMHLGIFNITGQRVKDLYSGEIVPGSHIFHWDGTNNDNDPVPAGCYFYHLNTSLFQDTGRMILIR